ncbi:hypothetical protein [Microvirga aerophila]|uniref:hypothetical protein n=1 Tax=Microvirga aerophila TaxID=670291 RepID=UPI001FEF80D5|nr:hypothetical protein [Microvirga aerophila]
MGQQGMVRRQAVARPAPNFENDVPLGIRANVAREKVQQPQHFGHQLTGFWRGSCELAIQFRQKGVGAGIRVINEPGFDLFGDSQGPQRLIPKNGPILDKAPGAPSISGSQGLISVPKMRVVSRHGQIAL